MSKKSDSETALSEGRTWTFEPDDDVRQLVRNKMVQIVGLKNIKNRALTRGMRSKIINEAMRLQHQSLAGKSTPNV